jgi:hypothetical protein
MAAEVAPVVTVLLEQLGARSDETIEADDVDL